MKAFSISLAEFVPPIVPRLLRISRRLLGVDLTRHPFDQVPPNLEVKYVLDIGANIGDVALAALSTYPLTKVICFEPVMATRAILERRLASYGERVLVYSEALSSITGSADINLTSFHGANSLSRQSPMHSEIHPHISEIGKESVSLVRLDDFAQAHGFPSIDIMKIDVEGHELEVLQGGKAFISTMVDTIIIEASMMRDTSLKRQSVIQVFSLLGEMGFRLINIFDVHHVNDYPLMCIQMDCVFRHESRLA